MDTADVPQPNIDTVDLVDPEPIIVDCPHCSSTVDIIFQSSDGVNFAAHRKNCEAYSEALPFDSMNSPEAGIPTVKLEEDSNVIRLILQYMHLVPQPDITKLKFPLLEALSQAVEKYLIFSAMMVCKLCMKDNVARYPMSVLRYAVTYQYKDLANVAAGYAAKRSILESRQFFGPHSRVFQAWSAYKDQWMAALPTIYTEHIPVGGLHKGGIPECDLWAPFVDGIRKDVKCSVAGVMEFGDLIEKRIDAHLESCERCTVRARRWSGSVTSIVGEALQFSDFMWGS